MSDAPVAGATIEAVPEVVPEAVEEAPSEAKHAAPNSGPRPPVRDRLRKVQIKRELVTLTDPDGDFEVEVRGNSTADALDMGEEMPSDEEGNTPARAANPIMIRRMVYDPTDGSRPFQDWTDDEVMSFPIAETNKLVAAIGRVQGRDDAPKEGSPSTTDDASSS